MADAVVQLQSVIITTIITIIIIIIIIIVETSYYDLENTRVRVDGSVGQLYHTAVA